MTYAGPLYPPNTRLQQLQLCWARMCLVEQAVWCSIQMVACYWTCLDLQAFVMHMFCGASSRVQHPTCAYGGPSTPDLTMLCCWYGLSCCHCSHLIALVGLAMFLPMPAYVGDSVRTGSTLLCGMQELDTCCMHVMKHSLCHFTQ